MLAPLHPYTRATLATVRAVVRNRIICEICHRGHMRPCDGLTDVRPYRAAKTGAGVIPHFINGVFPEKREGG